MTIDRNRFREIVDQWIREALQGNATERALRDWRDRDAVQPAAETLEVVLSAYVDALQRDDVTAVRHQVAELIVQHGLQLNDVEHRALAHEVLQGTVELLQTLVERSDDVSRKDGAGQQTLRRRTRPRRRR